MDPEKFLEPNPSHNTGFHPGDMSKLTSEVEIIYYYFQFLYFGKSHVIDNGSKTKKLSWPIGLEIFLRVGFAISRFIAYGKFIYFILQLNGLFNGIHGELEVFDVIEIYLWMLPTFFYVGDFMMYNSRFLKCMDNTFTLCNNLWEKVKRSLHAETAKKLRMSLKYFVFRFLKHSLFIDYPEYLNIMYSFVGTMEHKTSVYSILSHNVKSYWLEGFFTFLEGMNINWLLVAVSLMTTFPGIVSFLIENSLRSLSTSLTNGRTSKNDYSMEEIMKDYAKLEFSVRELNKTLGAAVLLFQFAQGAQQVAQIYCIFQLLRAGVEFSAFQMLFLDMLTTSSRLYHSFHAMSKVAEASEEFFVSLNRKLHKTGKRLKFLRAQSRQLKRIYMTAGPCNCNTDFPLTAISVYMDYYVAAALWPSPT